MSPTYDGILFTPPLDNRSGLNEGLYKGNRRVRLRRVLSLMVSSALSPSRPRRVFCSSPGATLRHFPKRLLPSSQRGFLAMDGFWCSSSGRRTGAISMRLYYGQDEQAWRTYPGHKSTWEAGYEPDTDQCQALIFAALTPYLSFSKSSRPTFEISVVTVVTFAELDSLATSTIKSFERLALLRRVLWLRRAQYAFSKILLKLRKSSSSVVDAGFIFESWSSTCDMCSTATNTFASLVKMVLLEAGLPDPPDFPEDLLKKRDEERQFPHSALGRNKMVSIGWLSWLSIISMEYFATIWVSERLYSPNACLQGSVQGGQVPGCCSVSLVDRLSTHSDRPVVLRDFQSLHATSITAYEVVRNDISDLEGINSTQNWLYCILDDGHVIKSAKTRLTKAVKCSLMMSEVRSVVEQAGAAFFYGHAMSSVPGGVVNLQAARKSDPATALVDPF
ncbi:hypothetical protein BDZ89DRAFT_1040546 [Hymenopellis radicata]|nr:hypothetical protein BDZ89DRAFT_1040546 [Hymenopellis radicata]